MEAPPLPAFKAKIAEELLAFARPMTDCRPHPDNARVHDLGSIAKSLQQNGQRAAIVVQSSTGYIVKGNGTWTAAAQLLGWTDIAQLWQDMSDEQALAFLLADNKASDGSSYDPGKLTSALGKMLDGPGLLDTLWTSAELEDYIEGAAPMTTLDPAESEAAYADPGLKDRLEERRAGARSMRLVQVTLTEAEHAMFMGWLRILRDRWGLTGWIATIYEAVKRQAEAEDAAPSVGRDLDAEKLAQVRGEIARELRDTLIAAPDRLSIAFVAAQLQPIIFEGNRSAERAALAAEDRGERTLAPVLQPDPPSAPGEMFKLDPAQSFDIPAEATSGTDH